jgi:hypothetical protein
LEKVDLMPNWTDARKHERSEGRAARVTALYLLDREGKLPDIPKTELARRLGISRWTLDRDLASVEEVESQMAEIMQAINEE